jgi:hypothetical protein
VRPVTFVAVLLVACGFALGIKTVWIFQERPCPPAHIAQGLGLMDGMWRCLPIGVTPAEGDAGWWNSLPTGDKREEVGVYLANVRVRVFSYSNVGGHFYVGFDVPAPEYH